MAAGNVFAQTPNSAIKENGIVQATKTSIPDRMSPNTIIKYDSPDHFTIESGGYCNAVEQDELNNLLNKRLSFINKYKNEIKDGAITVLEKPTPISGMVVVYDGEGYLKKITPDNTALLNSKTGIVSPMTSGSYASNGMYYWGAHNNAMSIIDTAVTASGRFTNFTDTYGERDNVLQKGDVATKYALDNPPYGTAIACDNFNDSDEGYNIWMYKRDIGSLPDACLDIWKYGVEYFGVSWSPNVSIDNAGYIHSKL